MANRSDREQGQPKRCLRRHSLISRMGPRSRTPSGPAVSTDCIKQAGQKTAPDQCHYVNLALAMREPSTESDLLARKPTRVATVAMANKTARVIWAIMARGETYRTSHQPALAA